MQREAPLVLVVDDDQSIRLVLRHFLESNGFRVEEAADGDQALCACQAQSPDIVLLDVLMPGMDGFVTCDRLRRLPGGEKRPVMMVTSLDDEQAMESAFEAGASDFITKPIQWPVLRQRIRHLLSENYAQERIQHLAFYDAITGLPNRLLFNDRLQIQLSAAHRSGKLLVVMFLGLDRFKSINDSLGHVAGDQLLHMVGDRLVGVLRSIDTIARVGGDEFSLLLPQIDHLDGVVRVSERIMTAMAFPFNLTGQEIYLSACIGISVYPNDGKDAMTLAKNADTALHRAKEGGRNRYQFYLPEMNARVFEQLAMEGRLRRALKRGEFLLYYQPQVALYGWKVVGMEALIRWKSPEHGLLPPSRFIPLAEETGLILPMGEWVLRTACAQNRAWQDAGLPPLRVSVNVSALQFRQKNLASIIAKILEETRLDARYLELELSESSIMENAEKTIQTLWHFKEMGLEISIDDFGTGYSSLSYLKRFPIDKLKIDQSFVRELSPDPENTNPNDAAIAKAIISIGHSLNLKVIAEGVETKEQLTYLRAQGCDEVQGYFFSRPVPVEDFPRLLEEGGLCR